MTESMYCVTPLWAPLWLGALTCKPVCTSLQPTHTANSYITYFVLIFFLAVQTFCLNIFHRRKHLAALHIFKFLIQISFQKDFPQEFKQNVTGSNPAKRSRKLYKPNRFLHNQFAIRLKKASKLKVEFSTSSGLLLRQVNGHVLYEASKEILLRRPRQRPPVKTSYNGTSGSEEVKKLIIVATKTRSSTPPTSTSSSSFYIFSGLGVQHGIN